MNRSKLHRRSQHARRLHSRWLLRHAAMRILDEAMLTFFAGFYEERRKFELLTADGIFPGGSRIQEAFEYDVRQS